MGLILPSLGLDEIANQRPTFGIDIYSQYTALQGYRFPTMLLPYETETHRTRESPASDNPNPPSLVHTRPCRTMLTIGILLFTSAAAASAIPSVAAPQPKLVASEYYGSSCPAADLNGLKITMGSFSALNATTDVAPLDFTLSKGNPNLGDFFGDGATLRMCDVLANVTVDPGWKVVVNAQGTQAQGFATLNGTLGIRATYQFTDKFENQVSIVG